MGLPTLSSKIFFGYFFVVGALFCATAGPDMVNDMMHVDKKGNLCNACAQDKQGKLTDLSIQIGTIYCQVIGAMAIMVAMAVYFEGSKYRTFATMVPFVSVMAKHIVVDGLIPPVPVMALAGIVIALAAFVAFGTDGKGTDYGKYAFLINFGINLAVFVADPGQIVKDTWSGAEGAALGIGTIFVGVIQLYCAMLLVLFVIKSPMSHFVGMTLGMGQLYRDIVLNEGGPPLPVLVLFVGVFFSSAYGAFVEKTPAAEKMKM